MSLILLTFGSAALICVSLVPPLTRLARSVRLVDVPDGMRKIHTRPIPLVGGIAIFAAVSAALLSSLLLFPEVSSWFEKSTVPIPGLVAAAVILCFVGIADDRFGLRGRHKLAGQAVAVGVLIYAGGPVQNIDLFGWSVHLGPLAVPFTAFWLLGAINSLNLIDGMDGMVGCVGAIIAVVIAVMAFWTDNMASALMAVALAGAIIGFLFFNLPPARIYLGDCGSMLIGLVIGVLALHCAFKATTTVMLSVPLALLTIPIFDTTAALTRRTLTGRSIYTTDRGHLHHCLQRSGLSGRRVLVLVSSLCLLTGAGALASLAFQRQVLAVAAAAAAVGILLVTRLFGHAELLLLKKCLASVALRLLYGRRAGQTDEISVQLQGSADWLEIWQSLTDTAKQLQLSSVRLDVNIPALHEGFHARWDRLGTLLDGNQHWRVEIPLAFGNQVIGRLAIEGVRDEVPVFEKIAILGKIAEDVEQSVSVMAGSTTAAIPLSESSETAEVVIEPETAGFAQTT